MDNMGRVSPVGSDSKSDYSEETEYLGSCQPSRETLEACPEDVQRYIRSLNLANERLKKELIIMRNKLNTLTYSQENQIEQLKKQLSEKSRRLAQHMLEDEVKGNVAVNTPLKELTGHKDNVSRPNSFPGKVFVASYKQNDYLKNRRDIPETLTCRNVSDSFAAARFAMGIDE